MQNSPTLLISVQALKNNYSLLRLRSETLASTVQPGHSINIFIAVNNFITASVMSCDALNHTIEVLAETTTDNFSEAFTANTPIRWQGLIGKPQRPSHISTEKNIILIAENIHIAGTIFFCKQWRESKPRQSLLVLLGLSGKSPFPHRPSQLLVPGMPEGIIASLPLLDDWGIPSRIASSVEEAGCYAGTVQELLQKYQSTVKLENTVIYFSARST